MVSSWTCRRCTSQRLVNPTGPRKSFYSTTFSQKPPKSRRNATAVYAAAGTTLLGGGYFFQDDFKHMYKGVERSGRVVSTLYVCISDYRTTLRENEKAEDNEEWWKNLKNCHQRCADRTLKVLEKNGSIFIKLGQHLSAMNYLLPEEWAKTFIPLQDKCPVSSIESIEAMFLKDTGEPLSEYFSDFAPQPIGAASLAQVHLATVKETGQRVAVKVQHPALEEWASLDLALTSYTFRTLKRFFPEYDMEWLSSEMEASLPLELDFELEGRNARRAKEYFSHIPELPLVIPDVIWAKRRILVMENVSGHRLDDLEFLDSSGIDRDEVSASLARIFNEMIFGTGAPLHCDPHGGNIAIRKHVDAAATTAGAAGPRRRRGNNANFDIILYDHGLYRDIPQDLRRSYAKLWLAVIDADEPRMRRYAREVAGITDAQFPLFASAITGRDYRVVVRRRQSIASTARTEAEKRDMGDALGDGLLEQLVQMLGQVPRIILLILKTNDLTRSLDENLQTRSGPMRTFLILARYCSRTVFEEQLEIIAAAGSVFWPRNAFRLVAAWLDFFRVEVKLEAFEIWLSVKRSVGVTS